MTSTAAYKISGSGASAIAASIESGISAGFLPPGEPLPPIRDLADALGVNQNTVTAAYRLLRDRGAVETAVRRGTRVRERPATAPRNLGFAIPEGARDLANGSPDRRLLPPVQFGLGGRAAAKRLYEGEPVIAELVDAAREKLTA